MTKRPHLLIPLIAAIPFLFYAVTGYGGHDFRFHVTAWLELHQAWQAHEFTLGWSSLSQYGHGDPRFTFYPPFSLLAGTVLTFLLPFRLVPAAIPWLILTTAGLTMYFAAARLLPPSHRLPAALAYMLNPYLLLTLITRYAVAEAWVQAFFPLTFLFFYRTLTRPTPRTVIALGILLGAGWLTNIPAAIILAYALTLTALVLTVYLRTPRPFLATLLAQSLGALLAAFRLLPAYTERRLVAPKALLGYSFRDQMPTLHQHHILVLVCALLMCVAAAISLLSARAARPTIPEPLLTTLLTLAALSFFFETPVSDLLWTHLPELKYVQFPFRFLFLLSFAATLLLFQAGTTRRLRIPALALTAALALLPYVAFARLLPLNRFPDIAQARASWSQGFEGTPEYVPTTAILQPTYTPQSPPCPSQNILATPNTRTIQANVPTACFLTLPTFFYPFWTATLDNTAVRTPDVPSPGGLIAVLLPAGQHRVTLRFAQPPTFAIGLSLITFLSLVFTAIQRKKAPANADSRPNVQQEPHPKQSNF